MTSLEDVTKKSFRVKTKVKDGISQFYNPNSINYLVLGFF